MGYTKSKVKNQIRQLADQISRLKRRAGKTKTKNQKLQRKNLKLKTLKIEKLFIIIGSFFFIIGSLIFILTFYPVVKEEVRYQVNVRNQSKNKNKDIKPVDEEFGIVIPKILANAKVIANVDPFDEKVYQMALTKGVAHAKGTVLPDVIGNTFIFSHSSVDWYTANRYNSVFYLLNKLEKDDDIYLYYQKQKYHYQVVEKKIVEASAVEYLTATDEKVKTLTLMTCWPPGTSLKRLIVRAKLINN